MLDENHEVCKPQESQDSLALFYFRHFGARVLYCYAGSPKKGLELYISQFLCHDVHKDMSVGFGNDHKILLDTFMSVLLMENHGVRSLVSLFAQISVKNGTLSEEFPPRGEVCSSVLPTGLVEVRQIGSRICS